MNIIWQVVYFSQACTIVRRTNSLLLKIEYRWWREAYEKVMICGYLRTGIIAMISISRSVFPKWLWVGIRCLLHVWSFYSNKIFRNIKLTIYFELDFFQGVHTAVCSRCTLCTMSCIYVYMQDTINSTYTIQYIHIYIYILHNIIYVCV